LEDGLDTNMLEHSLGNDISISVVRRFLQESLMRRLGSQGKGCKGVHDHVDPEHLDGSKNGLLSLESRDEHDNDSDHIDRELELEELSNGIVDVSAPHHSGDNGGEVIIQEDDIGSLSGDLSTGITHGKSDISPL